MTDAATEPVQRAETTVSGVDEGHPACCALQRSASWLLALTGLAVFVFAVVAISSGGRIDVIDGQTRYQVARSIVEHGDSVVRDADTWFAVFPGRNGDRYSNYRFPHTLVAAASILVADATGPTREVRRQFFFSLSGAVLCGLIAALYADWFRRAGHGRLASILWAAGGIFCTPLWYYGTTAYDDVLGTLVVLTAIYAAARLANWEKVRGRVADESSDPAANKAKKSFYRGAALVGLLMGLAFNCKPPLVLLMPAVIALLWRSNLASNERRQRARVVCFYAALGVIVYELYDLWKFPPSTWAGVAEARGEYVALWPGNPLAGLLSLLISPGVGALWYWPAIVLALYGLTISYRRQRQFSLTVGLSSAAFLVFIGTIRFFSGEPSWGPRYLTPVFGLLWLFVPVSVACVQRWKAATLLAVSLAVQVLGLTLEPMRFFTGDNVVAAEAFLTNPWTYFRFDRSQLLARPSQLWDVLTYDGPPATSFTPAKAPTLPLIIYVKTDKRFEARDYQVLSSLRPWWVTYRGLPLDQRPIDLRRALEFLLLAGGAGLVLTSLSFWPFRRVRPGWSSETVTPSGWTSQVAR
ncbi:MAG TPA: hypothetical protein VHC22_14340 [Pirellulales bacterium]|nr:hypothetical protein [Pirellulales bacterium]